MIPRNFISYSCNGSGGNVKFSGQTISHLWTKAVPALDLHDLRINELMAAIFNALSLPRFIHHVFHIILRSSRKKMVRIYALWIIARMTNKNLLVDYWSMFKFIRKPVCTDVFGILSSSYTELPVSIFIFSGDPIPALILAPFINLFPKPFFRISLLFIQAFSAAIKPSGIFSFTGFNLKNGSTCFAI